MDIVRKTLRLPKEMDSFYKDRAKELNISQSSLINIILNDYKSAYYLVNSSDEEKEVLIAKHLKTDIEK